MPNRTPQRKEIEEDEYGAFMEERGQIPIPPSRKLIKPNEMHKKENTRSSSSLDMNPSGFVDDPVDAQEMNRIL
jgi:hypothetical protein